MTAETQRLLDADEMSHVLKISREALWRLARQGTVPSLRVGRLLRFDEEKVLLALEKAAQAECVRGRCD
jgi:excisionase family DNA binding protein